MYADIIVDITHEKLDKVFQYSIPSELEGALSVGTEVIVPFGKGNRERRPDTWWLFPENRIIRRKR